MNKRNNSLLAASLLFSALTPFCQNALAQGETNAQKKPNVLFIAIDDLRPELGCYGKDYIKSPNIDALASNGIVFTRAYCQQAVCSPSRSSLLTGMRPDTTKVWDLVTHFRKALPDAQTLPQLFKNNGYFTQGMGKIFHGSLNDEPSWSVPWVVPSAPKYALAHSEAKNTANVEGEPDSPPTAKEGKKNKKKGKKSAGGDNEEGGGAGRGMVYECADVPDNTYQDGKVADLAIQTLKELSKKDQPFFLAVGFIKPHLPWVSPKKYWDMYDEQSIKLAPNPFYPKDAPDYAVRKYDGEIYQYLGMSPKGTPVPDELAHKLKHAYFASVSYTDAQVGRVMAELKTLGLDKNTVVILWGDHGWKLGEHGAWGKHSNVENDANAPLIISVPGMKSAGSKTDSLVEFVDIYPTLADLAGLPLPATLEGTSFKPLLNNLSLPWKTAAFNQYPRNEIMGYSMRTDRYRFTVWCNKDDHTKIDSLELYDHKNDPQENTNIAKDPANAELVKTLMDQFNKGWQGNKPPTSSTTPQS